MQERTFDFSAPNGPGPAPVTYAAPAATGLAGMQCGTMQDPIHTQGGTEDITLKQELGNLDQIAHVQPTSQGMEYQIQQLVLGQRHILQEFERLKDHLNQNFADIEELKRVSGFAKEYMGKPAAAPQGQQGPQSPMNSVSSGGKKDAKTSVPQNLGYQGQIGGAGIVDTLHGHYKTAANYMGGSQQS